MDAVAAYLMWFEKFMKSILLGAVTALTITGANAAENMHSAAYILPYCKLTANQAADSPSNSYLVGRCAGLVEGVINMSGLLRAMQTVGDIQHLDPLLCAAVPEQVTIEQAINVVLRYGETHPREAQLPFTVLVLDALHDSWPCK